LFLIKVPKAKRMTIRKLRAAFRERFFRIRETCENSMVDLKLPTLTNTENSKINASNNNPPAAKNIPVFNV